MEAGWRSIYWRCKRRTSPCVTSRLIFSISSGEVYDAGNNRVGLTFPATTGGTPPIVRFSGGNMPFNTPIAVDAVAGNRLIISGNNTVYESTNQGNNVTTIDSVSGGANQIAKIAYGGRFGGSDVPGVLFYGSGSNIRYRTAASGTVTSSVAFPGGNLNRASCSIRRIGSTPGS